MKVFISWSKDLSRECAEVLQKWIKCTLQASKPWVSSKDIDKGTLWFSEINDQLKNTQIGIVCLTKANKDNPWILFESGALAKGLTANKVHTFLIDLKPEEVKDPLAQFNATVPTETDMKALLTSINKSLGEHALEEKILDEVFDMYWPQLDKDFKTAIKNHPKDKAEEKEVRSSDDILYEILNTTRNLDKRIRHVEDTPNIHFPTKKLMLDQDNAYSVGTKTHPLRHKIKRFIEQGLSPNVIANLLEDEASKSDIKVIAQEIKHQRDIALGSSPQSDEL